MGTKFTSIGMLKTAMWVEGTIPEGRLFGVGFSVLQHLAQTGYKIPEVLHYILFCRGKEVKFENNNHDPGLGPRQQTRFPWYSTNSPLQG